MNHAGEITPLVGLVRPHVALITTIAPVHIEYLGSIEAIADAKAEIFSGVEPGGVAVLNRDAPQFERLAAARARAACACATFGASEGCDARLIDCRAAATAARASRVDLRGARARLSTSARRAGTWRKTRSACCWSSRRSAPIGRRRGGGAGRLRAAEGARRALHAAGARRRRSRVIDESYNANPASMRAALALLGAAEPGAGGRRIAVIGDMLELGRRRRGDARRARAGPRAQRASICCSAPGR